MKRLKILGLVLLLSLVVSSCGETVRGVGRDFGRVGRGIKTVFVSDGE